MKLTAKSNYYVQFKNGEAEYFETELEMYKFLYEGVYESKVVCYGRIVKG